MARLVTCFSAGLKRSHEYVVGRHAKGIRHPYDVVPLLHFGGVDDALRLDLIELLLHRRHRLLGLLQLRDLGERREDAARGLEPRARVRGLFRERGALGREEEHQCECPEGACHP